MPRAQEPWQAAGSIERHGMTLGLNAVTRPYWEEGYTQDMTRYLALEKQRTLIYH